MAEPKAEYRIDDLARAAGTTVRNVRAYQDRGLLAPPRREGRVALYDERHLARLRLIGQLLDRGYPLAAIRDLTEAWDGGRSLGAVLGLVTELKGPWTDEVPARVTRAELLDMFGPAITARDVLAAVEFGLVEPDGESFRVPSPRLLAIGRQLAEAGVAIEDVLEELRRLRTDMERIAGRFVTLAARPMLDRYIELLVGDEVPEELSALISRLRPMAQQAVDAEFARAMRMLAGPLLEDLIRRYVGDEPRFDETRPESRLERIQVEED